jgi:hypothetical protein
LTLGRRGIEGATVAARLRHGPDAAKNRAAAREIMTRLGFGRDKRLTIKVAGRNIPAYRDPAVILIDPARADTAAR